MTVIRTPQIHIGYKFCAVFFFSALLFASALPEAACPSNMAASESSSPDNSVAEYLEGATENTHGEDHRQVLKQALTDMLNLPIKRLCEKTYPEYEMHPYAWSITVILERYIEPKQQDRSIDSDKFIADVKKPEAQRAIREWLVKLNREEVTSFGSRRARNTVEDYLNGAEQQSETDDQRVVIKQAFADMLYEPVESLRKNRYPDYQMHPHKWPITEVLYRYIVPDPLIWFDDDEFFCDVKKPEAQEMIQKWLDYLNNPGHKSGPAREERP